MIYPFRCPNCQTESDIRLKVADRNTEQQCANCGHILQRKMATGMAVRWLGRWRDQWRNTEGHQDGLGVYGE